MIRFSNTKLLLAATVSICLTTPVLADVTADELGSRLGKLMTGEGARLSWDSIEGSGSEFMLKGMKAESNSGGDAATIGDVPLREVTELDGGDYRVGEIEFPSLSITRSGLTLTLNGVSMQGLLVPGPNSTDPMAGQLMSDSAHVAELTATSAGRNLFRMSDLVYEVERSEDGMDLTYVAEAEEFSSDLSKVEDPRVAMALKALQIDKINGSMATEGGWSMKSGQLDLKKFEVTFDDQGKIGLSTSIGGYTQDYFKAVNEARAASANATPEQRQAQALAMLGLMQQLTLNSATIRYDDASFAMRALEMAAATQNARAADLPGTAQMLLPMVLPQYLPAELVQPVTAETVKFLTDPKNLEIKFNPPQPAPVMLLLGIQQDPKTALKALGLSVLANQ